MASDRDSFEVVGVSVGENVLKSRRERWLCVYQAWVSVSEDGSWLVLSGLDSALYVWRACEDDREQSRHLGDGVVFAPICDNCQAGGWDGESRCWFVFLLSDLKEPQ